MAVLCVVYDTSSVRQHVIERCATTVYNRVAVGVIGEGSGWWLIHCPVTRQRNVSYMPHSVSNDDKNVNNRSARSGTWSLGRNGVGVTLRAWTARPFQKRIKDMHTCVRIVRRAGSRIYDKYMQFFAARKYVDAKMLWRHDPRRCGPGQMGGPWRTARRSESVMSARKEVVRRTVIRTR